jgi:translocator protein
MPKVLLLIIVAKIQFLICFENNCKFVKNKNMQLNKTQKILISVVTCLGIGFLSGQITKGAIKDWYPMITKPFFNPPNWVFAPVWTLLFVMMGISVALVWNKIEENSLVKTALKYFVIQLVLNFLWSILFFGLHNTGLALIEIILLWLMIYETYKQFLKIDKLAAKLLIPYLCWVGFATILNASIWFLNR